MIMTYNVGYLSGMTNNRAVAVPVDTFQDNQRELIDLINFLGPDFVAFQEIDFGASRSYRYHQLDSVVSQTSLRQGAMVVNWDKRYVPFPYWPPSMHFGRMLSGQALASAYPVKGNERIVLDKPLNAPFYYNAFYLDRLMQVNEVKIGENTLKVINVHLEAFDQETREKQALQVLKTYNQLAAQHPVILLGDFNASAELKDGDNTIATIMKGEHIAKAISDSSYYANREAFYTYSSASPRWKIDYIFYNKDQLKAVSARVVGEAGTISDHLPVLMKFAFVSDAE